MIIKVKKSVLQFKISKARECLLKYGIVAIDGSGHKEVEGMLILLAHVCNNRLKVIRDK